MWLWGPQWSCKLAWGCSGAVLKIFKVDTSVCLFFSSSDSPCFQALYARIPPAACHSPAAATVAGGGWGVCDSGLRTGAVGCCIWVGDDAIDPRQAPQGLCTVISRTLLSLPSRGTDAPPRTHYCSAILVAIFQGEIAAEENRYLRQRHMDPQRTRNVRSRRSSVK